MDYNIQDFCCICLNISEEKCDKDSSKYRDNLSPLNKIKIVFSGLSTVMDSDCTVCKKCCDIIDLIYEFHKICLKNTNSYRQILNENQLQMRSDLFVNLNESISRFHENVLTLEEVKIEPLSLKSFVNNDVILSNAGLALESRSSDEVVEVKEEIEFNRGTFDVDSETERETETSWLDSKVKIEIDENDLKRECTSRIDKTSEDAFLKSNIEDYEKNSVQLTKEVVDQEEEKLNMDLLKDRLLEFAQGHCDSIGQTQTEHLEEDPIHEKKDEVNNLEYNKTPICESELKNSTHTGIKPYTYKCNICGKLFRQKGELNRHYIIHTGEKPHKCNICEKLLSRKDDLKRHYLIHTGEKPYKCDICGKLFSRKEDLKRHFFIHTGEKSHKCDICGKLFAYNKYLKKHILSHTEEKSHKCDICGKLFSRKEGVKRHYLIHTGEKPHKCNICGRSFNVKNNLKTHFKIHK